jgi:hypothetical protein
MSNQLLRKIDRILYRLFGEDITTIIYKYIDSKSLYYIQCMDSDGDMSYIDAIFKSETCAVNYLIIKHGAFGDSSDLPIDKYIKFQCEPLMYGRNIYKGINFPTVESPVLEDVDYHYGAHLAGLPCMNINHIGTAVGYSICLKCLNYIVCSNCNTTHDYCVMSPLLLQLHESLKTRKNWLQNNAGYYAVQTIDTFHSDTIECNDDFI